MTDMSQVNFKSVAVFLGPSLQQNYARAIFDADYYPPAQKGDIYKIMASGVETIILVDGVFHSTPSVWQRELVDAINEGIQVLGASSIGALRAAELHSFGMIGYGTIFEWYCNGTIDGDDEVALLHSSEEVNFRPLSEPLVNIRYTLLKAVEDFCLTGEQAQQLTDYAKQTYYPDRSYRHLLNSPILKGWDKNDLAKLEYYFTTKCVNLKRIDAVGVLHYCASLKERRETRSLQRCFPLEGATILQRDRLLLNGFISSQGIVLGEEVLQQAQKDAALLAATWTTLSKQCFILEWANQNSVVYPEEQLDAYIEQWEKDNSIVTHGIWLQANGLTYRAYRALLAERALVDWITRQTPAYFELDWSFAKTLWEELQLSGKLPQSVFTAQISEPIKPLQIVNQTESLQSYKISIALLNVCVSGSVIPERNCTINFTSNLEVDTQQASYARSAEIQFELSQRRFIIEWAKQNGISCPPDRLGCYIQKLEQTHDIIALTERVETKSLSFASYRALVEECAFVDWILEQGPEYFGIPWNFDVALLKELQITGKAAQLIDKRQAK